MTEKIPQRPTRGRIRRRPQPRVHTRPADSEAEETPYEVGWGKPPKNTRFKPGQSGNPKGRPKGTRNTKTILVKVLDEKITYRSGSGERQISVREGIALRLRDKALKGDHNAIKLIMSMDEEFDLVAYEGNSSVPRPEALRALDEAILAEYEQNLKEAIKTEADSQSNDVASGEDDEEGGHDQS